MATARHKRLKEVARHYMLVAGEVGRASAQEIGAPPQATPAQPTQMRPNYRDFKDEHIPIVALGKAPKSKKAAKK